MSERNWPVILFKAREANRSQAQVAREQKVSPAVVRAATKRHGIKLPKAENPPPSHWRDIEPDFDE